MSIHKSKGLEFPVVILADTTKRFNNKDATKPLLLHAQLGVGAKVTDIRRKIEYPTVARLAVARKLTREMTAEELRILYVAMTRAREKLIMVMTFADAGRELQRLAKDAASPVPPQVLENARSLADFILLPALTRPEAQNLLEEGAAPKLCEDGDTWDIRKISAEARRNSARGISEATPVRVKAAPEDVAELRQILEFKYPRPAAVLIPSKLTATELKGRFADYEAAEEAEPQAYAKKQKQPLTRPGFIMQKTALTPSERGTALHLAMQYIDYGRCESLDSIKNELLRLKDMRFLTEKQADAVEPKKILAFFASPLGRRVLRADKLYREFKFSLLEKAADYYPGTDADDDILLQGVVDCCFEEDGALHIVDFKSDFVTGETLEEKSRLYAPQLTAYGKAMARMIGLPVKSRLIYFFALDKVVEV